MTAGGQASPVPSPELLHYLAHICYAHIREITTLNSSELLQSQHRDCWSHEPGIGEKR